MKSQYPVPHRLDPGLLLFLQRAEGLTPERMERLLNEEAGLLGLSGVSGDMRTLLNADDAGARLAVDVYSYRARKYIGAYLAALGGADAILFGGGGGVGEQAPDVRARILSGLEGLGIVPDPDANRAAVGVIEHREYITRHGQDMPEVLAWQWPGAKEPTP